MVSIIERDYRPWLLRTRTSACIRGNLRKGVRWDKWGLLWVFCTNICVCMRDEKYTDNYRTSWHPRHSRNIAVLLRWSNIATRNGPPAWFLITINNYSRYLRWVVKINWVRSKHDGESIKRRICINRSRRESIAIAYKLLLSVSAPFIYQWRYYYERKKFDSRSTTALALTVFVVLLHVIPGLFDTLASA